MRRAILVILTFLVVSLIFFYPIFKGKVPFPGDLLIGEYAPYNSYNFMGYAPGGYPNKGQDFDVIRLLYPEKEFSIRSFKNLELPLWNPYNFSGTPHVASLQSGSFYPLNVVFFMLPYALAWIVFIFLQPFLTGLFSFLFARELKLGVKAAIFSALIFAFSSYAIVWMEYGNIGHSIVWMPFSLWLALKNIKKTTVFKSAIISVALTFAILAGHIQTAFYVFVFLLGFVAFNIFLVDRENKLRKSLIFFTIFTLPVFLSAIQLLPMIELFFQSARAPYPHEVFLKLLIPLFHGITVFVPDFFGNPATRNYWLSGTYIERVTYIGVIPLIFIFYSFFKKQTSTFWFFVISAAIILLITFDTFLARLVYLFEIPFVSTAVPTRIMFIYCFCASMIVGFGMDAFEKDANRKNLFKAIFILGGIYVSAWIFTILVPLIDKSAWVQNLNISKRNLLLPTAIFFVSAAALFISFYRSKYRQLIIIFLILLSMVDLFYFFHKITPFSTREAIYPPTEVLKQLKDIQGIDRSWGYGRGYITTNLQTFEKIFSVDGYNALHIKRYGELLASSENGRLEPRVPGSDANLIGGYGEGNLKENRYRQRVLSLLGVKYVLNKNEALGETERPEDSTFPKESYSLVWQGTPWQIYENKEVLPRIFLASDYIVEKDKDKIIKLIQNEQFNLKEKLILEEEIFPKVDFAKDANARVEIKKYAPNEVILRTDSQANSLLFISDNYDRGWKVSIDGEFAKIYRADYSFRAVLVAGGKHEVIFSYYPESFNLGVKISLATLIAVTLSIILSKLRNSYVKK